MKRIPEHIFWPGLIIAILSMSFISGGILVYVSTLHGGAQAIEHSFDTTKTESIPTPPAEAPTPALKKGKAE